MISIIVCSRKPDVSLELRQNIDETIGCEYEWVVIDNSKNQYNIFQAYNKGVEMAKGDVLCFMHDDVLFHSLDWGMVVNGIFNENDHVGAIGIQGPHVLFDLPAPLPTMTKYCTWQLYDHNSDCLNWSESGGAIADHGYWYGNHFFVDNQKTIPVASIDGVMMCIRHSLFNFISFDADTYGGFHCYDADISMQVNMEHYDLLVSNEILIEHKGLALLDEAYFKAAEQWREKWKAHLPLVRGVDLSPKQMMILRRYTIDALERQKELLEYRRLKNTRAYRLGRAILSPFKFVRSFFKPPK